MSLHSSIGANEPQREIRVYFSWTVPFTSMNNITLLLLKALFDDEEGEEDETRMMWRLITRSIPSNGLDR